MQPEKTRQKINLHAFTPFRQARHWLITHAPPKDSKKLICGRLPESSESTLSPPVNSIKPESSPRRRTFCGNAGETKPFIIQKNTINPQTLSMASTLSLIACAIPPSIFSFIFTPDFCLGVRKQERIIRVHTCM